MMQILKLVAVIVASVSMSTIALAQSDTTDEAHAEENDRHAGYYYPEPQTVEYYTARIGEAPDASSRARIAFVTAITQQDEQRGYAPSYFAFVKGVDDEKLIIVGLEDGRFNTLYRIRALLAGLTSKARLTPLFQQVQNPENLTFLDVARFMGFTQVTISDGDSLAHQIRLE